MVNFFFFGWEGQCKLVVNRVNLTCLFLELPTMRNSNEARKKSIAEAAGMGRGNFRTEREKRE